MDTPTEIVEGLWLGSGYTAFDENFFRQNQIEAVLNCTKDLQNHMYKYGVDYLRLPVNDTLQCEDMVDMYHLLPAGVAFIHKKLIRERKNVLVHCHAGIQRSPTLVAAYLALYMNEPLEKVLSFIVLRRHVAFFGGQHHNFGIPLQHFLDRYTISNGMLQPKT